MINEILIVVVAGSNELGQVVIVFWSLIVEESRISILIGFLGCTVEFSKQIHPCNKYVEIPQVDRLKSRSQPFCNSKNRQKITYREPPSTCTITYI